MERDLQVLGVRRWRELVIDKTKWRDIVPTGQSLQRAVASMEEEEEEEEITTTLYSNIYPRRWDVTQFIYIWKLLYVFRVVPPPIIRGAVSRYK